MIPNWPLGLFVGIVSVAAALSPNQPTEAPKGPLLPVSEQVVYRSPELNSWIELLGDHENCKPEGTPDSGSLSYGRWCYKTGTFLMFVRQFKMLPKAEDGEVLNLIGDEVFQRKLTRRVFEDNLNNWKHWECTVIGARSERCARYGITGKGIGLPPK